jgi:hypothetical protein
MYFNPKKITVIKKYVIFVVAIATNSSRTAFVCLLVFETGPHCAAQAGLELEVFLPRPPLRCWDHGWTPWH